MATTTRNKRKKAVAATVAAAAILLAGTFAWTSISQQAKNEAIVDINPGARLHDDFNGSNKDVYVENFNSADDAKSVAVYARIRLDQYMEIGPDAGINVENGTADRNVKAITGTDSKDKSTWVTYIPDGDKIEGTTVQAQNHWQWSLGNGEDNKPFYMPTFNMNKDSLLADINGTYEGTVKGDIVHYDDYKTYTATTDTATGTEIVDWDSDTLDEDGGTLSGQWSNGGITTDPNTPIDSADVLHRENQTHNAKQITETASVITMAQWQKMDDAQKEARGYWVYDTDGWAYWSKPIEPGKTTGLLLDGINMNKTPDENWYYAINVVGQFATPGDLSAFDQDAPTGGGGMTDAAKDMMAEVTKLGTTLTIETGNGGKTIAPGGSTTIQATEKSAGMELEEQPEITWTVMAKDPDGKDVSDQITFDPDSGKLTVGADVPLGTEITVKAENGDTPPVSAEIKLAVKYMPEFVPDENMIVYFESYKEAAGDNTETDEYTAFAPFMLYVEAATGDGTGSVEGLGFVPKRTFNAIYDKHGMPIPASNYLLNSICVNEDEYDYPYGGAQCVLVPEGTQPGDAFTFVMTYEKDGIDYGASKTITWTGGAVTNIPTADNKTIPTDYTKDENMQMMLMTAKEAETAFPDADPYYPEHIDLTKLLVSECGVNTETDDVTAFSFDIYDEDGKRMNIDSYIFRTLISYQDSVGGSIEVFVPEGTKSGSKFTVVLTYEKGGVTYGNSVEYTWNAAE